MVNMVNKIKYGKYGKIWYRWMVRGSEETCNRKARDSDELLLTEKESSADDV